MKKLLVLNGKYYTGNKEFNGKRSDAVVIKDETEYKMLVGVLFCKIINGETELRRVEVIDAKEVEDKV
ncbi:MAG TPA: hypothetical protein VN456_12340 [Desulfosporosinus sp.]|nr:hypothetical protein [Desulfosporosinus sp.]